MKSLQERFEEDFRKKASKGELDLEENVSEGDCKALTEIVTSVANKYMRIVEVGSWKGKSTSVLGGIARSYEGRVYAIDHWRGNVDTWSYDIAEDYDVLSIFRNNIRLLGLDGVVLPMIMSSVEASQIFPDESLDLVFLDADHRYKYIKQDILSWLPKVKHGGVMCGHDCEKYYLECSEELKAQIDEHLNDDVIHGLCHPGVVKAVYERFESEYHIVDGSRIWYWKGVDN